MELESNVERTVSPDDEPHLLAQAQPFGGLPHLDGIGYLFDRGAYFEIRYDGCHHGSNFLRDRMDAD
jgi:hypothetical protein